MKILLYEHVSSGGLSSASRPPDLLSEGYGMLRSVAEDFKASGHTISIMLDPRIASLTPHFQKSEIVKVNSPKEVHSSLEKTSKVVDATFMIAPESNDILHSVVKSVEISGAISLNSKSRTIKQITNKADLRDRAGKLGLNFPKTLKFGFNESLDETIQSIRSTLGFPVVIKPSNGAGCGGLSVAQTEKQVIEAIEKTRNESLNDSFVAQEYIQGINASVSLISTDSAVLPISLNFQDISLSNPQGASSYCGGTVPFEHPLKNEAFDAAKNLLASFEGLKGYVGVDFVLTKDEAYVIEVNPRLTTSYVGLRNVINFNLAQAVIESITKEEIPHNVKSNGVAVFSKLSVRNNTISCWPEISRMDNLVSPPFPLSRNNLSCALIESHASNLKEAEIKLAKVKDQLNQLLVAGGE